MPTILTEEQAKERLNSSRNLVSRFGKTERKEETTSVVELEKEEEPQETVVTVIPLGVKGRDIGDKNFTEEEKIHMAVRRRTGEGLQSIANDYNTSRAVVQRIDTGKTKRNGRKIDELVEAVQDTALLKLMASLDLISNEKLSKLSARDLGNFASSMSKVIGNTKSGENDETRVHLHLYAPELRSEQSFKTIEVRGN